MTIRYALSTVLLFTLAGCPSEVAKTPVVTAKPSVQPQPAPEKKDEDVSKMPNKRPERSTIALGPKLAKLCTLPTAHFAFDSSALSSSATSALEALAKCFIDGAAKGKGMRIVGHADPRGETEYNFALGQRRAGMVAAFLLKRGMSERAIESSSRGELEATGSDDDGWTRDRKVEIFLAE